MFKKFKIVHLVEIALLVALATASKVFIGPIIRNFTNILAIPGGALIGGIYMLWLAVGIGLIKIPGTASLIAFTQALLVFSMGLPGNHGGFTFFTYTLPGILCDMVFLFSKKRNYNILHYILGTMCANLVGTFGSNLLFFRLPLYPLCLALTSASLSGAIGGLVAYLLIKNLEKIPILNDEEDDNE